MCNKEKVGERTAREGRSPDGDTIQLRPFSSGFREARLLSAPGKEQDTLK